MPTWASSAAATATAFQVFLEASLAEPEIAADVSRTRSFPDGRRLGHFSEPEVREAGDVGSRHLDGGAAAEEAEEVTDAELGAPDAPSAFDVVASQMALEQVIDEADVISSVS